MSEPRPPAAAPVQHQLRVQDWPRDREVPQPDTVLDLDDINLADPAIWARDDIDGVLALRREHRPVARDAHRSTGSPFWSVTRWADVAAVTSDPATFTSIHGVSASNEPGEAHPASDTMIVFDPPLHTMVRKLVNKGFTPRQVRALAPAVDRQVQRIVEELRQRPTDHSGRAQIDFVSDVAVRLPAAVICDMLGIPEADQQRMIELTSKSLSPRLFGIRRDQLPAIVEEIDEYGLALAEERRVRPTEDLTSLLVNGRIAEEPLAPDALGAFFRLLVLAGNETTRNALSGGMVALTEWPQEKQRWLDALDGPQADEVGWMAAEEIVRWASPVIHMKRNATCDTTLGGDSDPVHIAAGDKVVMWYLAVNRDPRHFNDPYRFDILRDPNHQGGFGTGGPHFCLGANLARREIAIALGGLLRAFPDIEVSGPISKSGSLFLNVVTELPVRYSPAGT
jgi:methyl-branched lipid omega-hydroxylase